MFAQLVRNLSNEQLAELNRNIDELPKGNSKIVVQAIALGKIDFTLFGRSDFPIRALRALKKGKIDADEFTTSQLFANVLRRAKREAVREIPLFCGEAPNLDAVRLIASSAEMDFFGKRSGILHGRDIDRFFQMMKSLKPCEQRLLTLIMEPPKYKSMGAELDNRGCHFLRTAENVRIIASRGILQCALQFLNGNNAVRMMTRFLLSSRELIQEEMLLNQRSFCLNFMGFSLDSAHGVFCDARYNDLEMHDWYHLQLVSSVPSVDKRKFCALSRACFKLSHLEGLDKFYLYLADQFADLENYAYFITPQEKAFKAAVFHIMLSTVKSELCTKENVKRFIEDLKKSILHGELKKLANELKVGSEYYEKEYGLNIAELEFLGE